MSLYKQNFIICNDTNHIFFSFAMILIKKAMECMKISTSVEKGKLVITSLKN